MTRFALSILMTGLVAIMITGPTIVTALTNEEKPVEVDRFARPAKIATARKADFQFYKTFPGVTEASRNSVLAFRVAGQIEDLPVRSGQSLKEGQLIARLDDVPYRNIVESRQASFDLAQTQLTRTQALFDKKHVAKAALDGAKAEFAAAEVALKSAKEDVDYTRLVAPYDGVIARIDAERYQNVAAGMTVVNFQGVENVDFVFNVPEKLFLQFNPKMLTARPTFDIQFDAIPELQFVATYKEHDELPDTVTRSFKVTATMPRPDDLTILPGMSVSVSVNVGVVHSLIQTEGVLVPLEAVFEEDGKRWVWKVNKDNQTEKTEVSVLGIEDASIRITSGLSDGDKVVAIGVAYVTEGMKVRPLQKEGGL